MNDHCSLGHGPGFFPVCLVCSSEESIIPEHWSGRACRLFEIEVGKGAEGFKDAG